MTVMTTLVIEPVLPVLVADRSIGGPGIHRPAMTRLNLPMTTGSRTVYLFVGNMPMGATKHMRLLV